MSRTLIVGGLAYIGLILLAGFGKANALEDE
jgi:hypothetical protein